MGVPFIALHLGAGIHSTAQEKSLRRLCKLGCRDGIKLLNEGKSSQEVAIAVCKILENSPLTNAGYGSQLNFDGVAECDASIMESSFGFGASVGAITGISNPIEVAGCLLKDLQEEEKDILGRVRPVMLVGRGAESYAQSKGIEVGRDLISPSSLAYYLSWRKLYQKYMTSTANIETPKDPEIVQDTVGVICGDSKGVIAVATSSGGTTLKTPGRVGPAGLVGTGLNISRVEGSTRAICLSGTGEDIILSQVGHNLCDILFSDVDFRQHVLDINFKRSLQRSPFYFGALGVNITEEGIDLAYLHTTEAFVTGYQFGQKSPVTEVSRNAKVGHLALGGAAYSYN